MTDRRGFRDGDAPASPAAGIFDGWGTLSWEERRERRFRRWLEAAGVDFVDDRSRRAYRERVQMVRDVLALKKPVRVPVQPGTGFYTGRYSGLTVKDMMYDHHRAAAAWAKFHEDFQPDFQADWVLPARVFDLLSARFMNWPTHGVDDDTPWQYLEAEYMKADEYDALIADPSAFFMRRLLPQFAEAFRCFATIAPFSDTTEAATLPFDILGFADPAVLEGVRQLTEAAKATLEQVEIMGAMSDDLSGRLGIPSFWNGMVKAPYDIIGDTLRGTRGIAMDGFRRRSKVIAAAERFVPLQIDYAVRRTAAGGSPLVCIPLHKGADGFMSDEDFRTLYWPTLREVLKVMIAEGVVPVLFAEGGYNTRLRVIADDELPAGAVMWWFDQTDMKAAKEALKGYAGIAGNVPAALIALGTGEEVERYVSDLLEECAADGGFMLAPGPVIDDARPEAFRAMIETARRWRG